MSLWVREPQKKLRNLCEEFVLLYFGGLHGYRDISFEHAVEGRPANSELGGSACFIAIAGLGARWFQRQDDQIDGPQPLAFARQTRGPDHAFQFAHVPRPQVAQKNGERTWTEPLQRPLLLAWDGIDK